MNIVYEGLPEVTAQLARQGYKYVGRNQSRNAVFVGNLSAYDQQFSAEVTIDRDFFSIPRIKLLEIPDSLRPIAPHVAEDGEICYISPGTAILDVFNPVQSILSCIRRCEEVLSKILAGEMDDNLREEFFAYWRAKSAYSDTDVNAQNPTEVYIGDREFIFISDNSLRTKIKVQNVVNLEKIACEVIEFSTPQHLRPSNQNWPPSNVGEVLDWLEMIDGKLAKSILRKIRVYNSYPYLGMLVSVKSKNCHIGFLIKLVRCENRSKRQSKSQTKNQCIDRYLFTRIDDEFILSRNTPNRNSLNGLKIILIGAGTIGGYLADFLVKSGAGMHGGELRIIDSQCIGPENIGRHRLGINSLFRFKAKELRSELMRTSPTSNIVDVNFDVREAAIHQADLIIDATGEEPLGQWLSENVSGKTPLLTTWIEGNGIAVRSLLKATAGDACFTCLCDYNREGNFKSAMEDWETNFEGGDCSSLYVPFSLSVSVQAASLAIDAALDWANGITSPQLRTRVTDPNFSLGTEDRDIPQRSKCPACHS